MKRFRDLSIAFLSAIIACSIAFAGLLTIGIEKAISARICGGALFAAIPYCHYLVSRWRSRRAFVTTGPPTKSSFFLPGSVLISIGTLSLLGVSVLSNGLAGIGSAQADDFAFGISVAAPILSGILAWAAFSVGQWIGRRTAKLAFTFTASVVLIVVAVNKVTEYVLTPSDIYENIMGLPKKLTSLLITFSAGAVFLMIAALLGAWRGKKTLMRSYTTFLIDVLPKTTQQTLVEIAQEEAYRAALLLPNRNEDNVGQVQSSITPSSTIAKHSFLQRSTLFPVLTFVAGIGGTLLTQAVSGHEQLLHAKRENKVAALREYASACSRTAISYGQVANLPLHFVGISQDPDLDRKQRSEKIYRMYDEANTSWRQNVADLAVQADVVNALFAVQVHPFNVTTAVEIPEFNVLPGQIDAKKMIEAMKQNPIEIRRKILLSARHTKRETSRLLL